MADKDYEFEQEMKKAEETRKKEKLLKELDFDDEKRLLIEINDKLGVIKARLGFIISAAVILFFVRLILLLFAGV
ncbi:MAG TPA: hypothetical protein IAA48_06780 [Candidatus Eubacterium faecipullorum]|uniref:Uncharacterized protein n=1 Tax=Candidatus Eubacterium faecipullorum TaxID=2838571 RepID=A0A9D1RGJ5_9FIRM|nr:hypothetical protein [Candidatus Eubacterium faecipullorum]